MLNKLKGGHWPIFILSSFSSLGNLFLPILLVRLLSPDEIGLYKIFFLYLTALPFLFMAGGPIYSVLYWNGMSGEEKQRSLNASWVLVFLLSSLMVIVCYPFRHEISAQIGLPVEYVLLMLYIGTVWCPSGHFSETSIARGYSARGSLFDAFFEFGKCIGFIIIAYIYKDLYGMFLFYASSQTVKLLVSAYLNRRINKITFSTDFKHLKKVLFYCLPVSASGCLGFFVDKLDLFILSSYLNASEFAFYSMGCLVIPPLYLLEMSVQKVLIPGLTKSYLAKEWREGSKQFRKGIGDVAFLVVPSIFGLCTFAGPIVTVLFTDQYAESVIYLQIFSLSHLFLIIPHDSAARASGKTNWIFKISLLLTPFSLIGLWMGAKYSGALAVLIISLTFKLILKILGLQYSKTIMHWTWKEMFPMRELALYAGTSALLSAFSLSVRVYFIDKVHWFITCGSLFAIIYLCFVYLRVRKEKYELAPAS